MTSLITQILLVPACSIDRSHYCRMALVDRFDQVDVEGTASPQHDDWHELRESLGQKVVATFHEGAPAEGSQSHTANVRFQSKHMIPHSTMIWRCWFTTDAVLQAVLQVLTALKAAIQGHFTHRAQASGIANAVIVAWLQNMSSSQQTQTFRPQLVKAISQADLTPIGAVQVPVACTIQDLLLLSSVALGFRGACNIAM